MLVVCSLDRWGRVKVGFFFSLWYRPLFTLQSSSLLPDDPAFSRHCDSASGRYSVLDWLISETLQIAHTPPLWRTKPTTPPTAGPRGIMKARRRCGGSDPVQGQNQSSSLSCDLCTGCVHHCLACSGAVLKIKISGISGDTAVGSVRPGWGVAERWQRHSAPFIIYSWAADCGFWWLLWLRLHLCCFK